MGGCWNGEKVRVVFAPDCCDREVMGFEASTCGISGSMVRGLMLECVEKRLGMSRAPHRVERLTGNGSCFAAKETVQFPSWLGLANRFTLIISPESNGMAEAFVKTFKRDYVYVNDRPDARTVLNQLAAWFRTSSRCTPTWGFGCSRPESSSACQQPQGARLSGGDSSKSVFKKTLEQSSHIECSRQVALECLHTF
jgi:transposase InsO family protein